MAVRYISEALEQWEPRITLENVGIEPGGDNCLLISVEYRVVATHSNRSLVYPFYLIPEETRTVT